MKWVTFPLLVAAFVVVCKAQRGPLAEQGARKRCWSSNNGLKAKWWADGSRIVRGHFWYICTSGKLRPAGCFTHERKRIATNETYVNNGYVMTCVVDSEGFLVYRYVGCAPTDGKTYAEGEKWNSDDNIVWYECERRGLYLHMALKGCVSRNDRKRMSVGEEMVYDDVVYECRRQSSGGLTICSVACTHKGQRYAVGQSWPDGDFVYYCKIVDGKCQKICVGCTFRNRKLFDGDRYFKGDIVYQCDITPNTKAHRPIACLQRDGTEVIERLVGCRWEVEDELTGGKHMVVMSCLEDSKLGGVPLTSAVGCIYRWKGKDAFFLSTNTYTIWKYNFEVPKVLACKRLSEIKTTLLELTPTEMLKTVGMEYVSPNGERKQLPT